MANGTLNHNWRCLEIRSNEALTSLDLSDLGNLEMLFIDDNAGLTSLDLSGLDNLMILRIYKNSLTSLDLSGLDNLKWLNISDNAGLTSLDLSGLGNLERLIIDDTGLTSLDLSGLGNLERLIIDDDAGLTSLDLSGLGNLETLTITDSSFTSLDLSSLDNLETLTITDSSFTSLDLSGLCSLQKLIIYDNAVLTDINWAGLTLDTPDDERLRTPPYEIYEILITPGGEYLHEFVPVNNSNVSCDQSSREEERPPTDADKESEEKITRADLNEEVIAEEIIRILTTMKPVLACEVFEALNKYNKSLDDLLKGLDDDLCQSSPSLLGSLINPFKKNIVDQLQKLSPKEPEEKVSLVDSFEKIEVLEIRDVNRPAPDNLDNNELIIEDNDLEILSYMPNLKTLKIMGNHTAGGMFGSDAKYNLTAIRDLELPEIENVYIDRNEKLTEISISQLDAERLVISDSDDSKFKSIKYHFGDTGRGHGNNQLKTINLGEKVKISNLYIGNSEILETINYESSSEVVDELVINTKSVTSLTSITIPSVTKFYLRKGDIKTLRPWINRKYITTYSIASNCYTLKENPGVFATLFVSSGDYNLPININDECDEDLEKLSDELEHLNELNNKLINSDKKYSDMKKDINAEMENLYELHLTPGNHDVNIYLQKIITLANDMVEKYQIDGLYNLIYTKAQRVVSRQLNIGIVGSQFLKEYDAMLKCEYDTHKILAEMMEAYGRLSKKLKVIAPTAYVAPVIEHIFSECESITITDTIEKGIDKLRELSQLPPGKIRNVQASIDSISGILLDFSNSDFYISIHSRIDDDDIYIPRGHLEK